MNIDEVKFRFLSELIYLFYFEIKQKFSDSFKVQLLSNYYALKFKQMEMLCIFQLRTFERHKLSKLDQVTFATNELFLLYEIDKAQRRRAVEQDSKQDQSVNGEYFIKIN